MSNKWWVILTAGLGGVNLTNAVSSVFKPERDTWGVILETVASGIAFYIAADLFDLHAMAMMDYLRRRLQRERTKELRP